MQNQIITIEKEVAILEPNFEMTKLNNAASVLESFKNSSNNNFLVASINDSGNAENIEVSDENIKLISKELVSML